MEWGDRRRDCCADWPKPCPYHEGYEDGFDAGRIQWGHDADCAALPIQLERDEAIETVENLRRICRENGVYDGYLEPGEGACPVCRERRCTCDD